MKKVKGRKQADAQESIFKKKKLKTGLRKDKVCSKWQPVTTADKQFAQYSVWVAGEVDATKL